MVNITQKNLRNRLLKWDKLQAIVFFGVFLIFSSFMISFFTSSQIIEIEENSAAINESENFLDVQQPLAAMHVDWNYSIGNSADDNGGGLLYNPNDDSIMIGASIDGNVSLIKIGNDGQQVWNISWGSPAIERIYDIVMDSVQNYYLCGYTLEPGAQDVLLVKFNSSGDYQWNQTWGQTGLYDIAYGIGIDNEDNIYLTGETTNYILSGYTFFLMKYASNGSLLWDEVWIDRTYAGGSDLYIDGSNTIHITGHENIDSGLYESRYLIYAEYDSDGNSIVNRTWGTVDKHQFGYGITGDPAGNIYITGTTYTSHFILATLMYNSTGSLQWARTIDKPTQTPGEIRGYDIVYDSLLNLTIVAYAENYFNDYNDDIMIIDYGLDGEQQRIDFVGTNKDETPYSAIRDNQHNFVVLGETESQDESNTDLYFFRRTNIPDQFTLTSDTETIQQEQDFSLSWSASEGADNYSVFYFPTPITEWNTSLSEIATQINSSSLPIHVEGSGVYYYIALASNEWGNLSSNHIEINVQIPPSSFILTHNAESPDDDGLYNLSWSQSLGADNYTLYLHYNPILEINGSVTIFQTNITSLNYSIYNPNVGTYYYAVMAINETGERLSNDIKIEISLSELLPESPNFVENNVSLTQPTINITWSEVSDAISYRVYRSSSPITDISTLSPIYLGTATSFSDYLITPGDYYYVVVAVNAYGNSTISAPLVVNLSDPNATSNQSNNEDTDSNTNNSTNPDLTENTGSLADLPPEIEILIYIFILIIIILAAYFIFQKYHSIQIRAPSLAEMERNFQEFDLFQDLFQKSHIFMNIWIGLSSNQAREQLLQDLGRIIEIMIYSKPSNNLLYASIPKQDAYNKIKPKLLQKMQIKLSKNQEQFLILKKKSTLIEFDILKWETPDFRIVMLVSTESDESKEDLESHKTHGTYQELNALIIDILEEAKYLQNKMSDLDINSLIETSIPLKLALAIDINPNDWIKQISKLSNEIFGNSSISSYLSSETKSEWENDIFAIEPNWSMHIIKKIKSIEHLSEKEIDEISFLI